MFSLLPDGITESYSYEGHFIYTKSSFEGQLCYSVINEDLLM